MKTYDINNIIVGIKGAGEMATGVAARLYNSNICKIFMMEAEKPLAVRRAVSFCESVYSNSITVENIKAVKALNENDIKQAWDSGFIPVIVDPYWNSIKKIKPNIVIDALISKTNKGTYMNEASIVIGLGPGFEAGKDVHVVIETNRGHNLGKVILKGFAEPNTGIPGSISGYNIERVLRSPCNGFFNSNLDIGCFIKKGDIFGYVEKEKITAKINGIIRGMIKTDIKISQGMKIGDIDPRGEKDFCTSISDKSRAVAGGTLEAILNLIKSNI